jgi:hypothetical protein
MITSAIATSHHYFVLLFRSHSIFSINKIVNTIGEASEKIKFSETKSDSYHLQRSLDYLYGSSGLLEANKNQKIRNGGYSYWYDFYTGKLDIEGDIYFIAFPYKQLQTYLFNAFPTIFSKVEFYTPMVKVVLEAMRKKNKVVSEKELLVEILRYTAEVNDDDNSDKVHIVGQNPQYSAVYDLLNSTKGIRVNPSSLRLRFWKENVGEIMLSFDRLGNYRIWIYKDKMEEAISMFPTMFQYFFKIKAIETKTTLSSYTTLDPNE